MTDIQNITSKDAYDAMAGEGGILVDVRTQAEWMFVGVPDLSALQKKPLFVEWQSLPTMQVNPGFAAQVAEAVSALGGNSETPIYFLCRSGQRSMSAAHAMAETGFTRLYNISDGFEGPLDPDRHRNRVAGWRASGLPWVQSYQDSPADFIRSHAVEAQPFE